MFARQGETRTCAVIERNCRPAGRLVAACTIGAVRALVGVVIAMTIDTLRRKPLVDFVDMTCAAGRVIMGAKQRKSSLRMVKRDLLPACDIVAGLADAPEVSFVRFVRLVATDARMRRLAIFPTGCMTAFAFDADMAAGKRVVGRLVIKSCFVKGDNPE